MAITEQFAGLDMEQLIGGPLSAAADASRLLADSTASFINQVGFDSSGKVRTVSFGYHKQSVNEDGTTNLDEMKVDIPMLAIVPIPNLQVDEVNILFDMEVKQSEKSESALDVGASLSGSLNLGIVKVSISGSVSVHQNNTRSSDNSAKYHVDVRATNHGIPEGLARVLDMMAANVAPSLVSSTIRDANGQSLPEASKARAERIKKLRQDISAVEARLSAARNALGDCITQLKRVAGMQQNAYQSAMNSWLNGLDKDSDAAEKAGEKMIPVNDSWNNMMNTAAGMIKMIADSQTGNAPLDDISDTFALLAWVKAGDDGYEAKPYDSGQSYYAPLKNAQNSAISAQKKVAAIEEELLAVRGEYNEAMTSSASGASGSGTSDTSGGGTSGAV